MVALGLGFAAREPCVQRQPQRVHFGQRLLGGSARVVIDAAQRLQRFGHRPAAPAGLGLAQRGQLRLQGGGGVAPQGIGLGAVEQRQQLVALRIALRRE
ncbi:hypothetical protein FQZ97_1100060 [compost metagenome]